MDCNGIPTKNKSDFILRELRVKEETGDRHFHQRFKEFVQQ